MKYVYILIHSHDVDEECKDEKILGIFSEYKTAKLAIKKYIKLPGFSEYTVKEFYIYKYELNKGGWKNGFNEFDIEL